MGVRVKKNKAIFNDFGKRTEKELITELRKSADRIEAGYKSGVPIDTGALKASINTQESEKGLVQMIGSNKEYAPYVEFGTGALVEVPEGLGEYAIQFKGAGIKEVNLPARPALYPVAMVEFVKLVDKLKKK